MNDVIITWASGEKFCKLPEFKVFIESIKRLELSFDTLIFTHDMSLEIRKSLTADGFYVIDVKPDDIHLVVRDRFLACYRWLTNHSYDRVLLTDSKDVVFQQNPFSNVPNEKEYVLLCHEGGLHNQSEWNSANQFHLQLNVRDFARIFSHDPIINSGYILGTSKEIQNLCLLLWSNSVMKNCELSEQATLNYLYFYLKDDPIYRLCHPRENCLAITGEAIKRNWLDFPIEFKNGMLYHSKSGEPCVAFHQWERTIYKDQILEAYL